MDGQSPITHTHTHTHIHTQAPKHTQHTHTQIHAHTKEKRAEKISQHKRFKIQDAVVDPNSRKNNFTLMRKQA